MPQDASPPFPPAVLETALYAPDLDAAHAVYGGVMGLAVVLKAPGRHLFYRLNGSMLLIFRADATREPGQDTVPPHGADGPGHVCFAADRHAMERWEARLTAAGIEVEARITWPNGACSIYARDPAGNSVEFAEPHLWG